MIPRIHGPAPKVGTEGSPIEETAGAPWQADVIAARVSNGLAAELDHASWRMGHFARPGRHAFPDADSFVGFLAWYVEPEEFAKRVQARVAETVAQPAGLPPQEREAELTRLRAKERELLRQEEVETCRLEARGFIVQRRRYPDVGLLLEVWDELG